MANRINMILGPFLGPFCGQLGLALYEVCGNKRELSPVLDVTVPSGYFLLIVKSLVFELYDRICISYLNETAPEFL